jgi:hypothetical protein
MQLRHRTTFIAIAIALSGTLLAGFASAPAVAAPLHATRAPVAHRVQVGGEAWQLFQATNESRGRFGVAGLVLDRRMSQIALRHTQAMVAAGTLFHTADVDTYLHGIDWHAWGENVGYTPGGVGEHRGRLHGESPPPVEHPEPLVHARGDRRGGPRRLPLGDGLLLRLSDEASPAIAPRNLSRRSPRDARCPGTPGTSRPLPLRRRGSGSTPRPARPPARR